MTFTSHTQASVWQRTSSVIAQGALSICKRWRQACKRMRGACKRVLAIDLLCDQVAMLACVLACVLLASTPVPGMPDAASVLLSSTDTPDTLTCPSGSIVPSPWTAGLRRCKAFQGASSYDYGELLRDGAAGLRVDAAPSLSHA